MNLQSGSIKAKDIEVTVGDTGDKGNMFYI